MKRILLLLVALATTLFVSAEGVADRLYNNPDLIFLAYRTYIEPVEDIASPPKGYKPCGMLLYGRHGSRYFTTTALYKEATKMFNKAEELGLLTPLGAEVKAFVERTQAVHGNHSHELSPLGFEQQRTIAHRAYRNFPKIFSKGATVKAMSSDVLRCVFSMTAFGEGLKELEPTLRFEPRAGSAEQDVVKPQWRDSELAPVGCDEGKRYRTRGEWYDVMKAWEREQDYDASLSRIVTDAELWRKETLHSGHYIAITIAKVLCFAANYDTSGIDLVRRFLAKEDMLKIYNHENYRWNHSMLNVDEPIIAYNILRSRSLVEDLIGNVERTLRGESDAVAHLRFTHDTFMVPFSLLLGVEGFEGGAFSVDEAHNHLRMSDRLCMAMNYQFVLYRNKRGEALVRCLLNERDIELPIEAAEGYFYEWQSLRKYLESRLAEMERRVRK